MISVDRLEYLYNNFYNSLLAYAKKYISDRDTCHDIVIDVLLKTYDKLDYSFRKPQIATYLMKCVVNSCVDKVRASEKVYLCNDILDIMWVEYEENERISLINGILNKLTSKRKQVAEMVMDGCSNSAICKSLSISMDCLLKSKHRVVKDLQLLISKNKT